MNVIHKAEPYNSLFSFFYMLPLSLHSLCNVFYFFFIFDKAKYFSLFIYFFFSQRKGEFTRLVEKISFWTQLSQKLNEVWYSNIGPDKKIKGLWFKKLFLFLLFFFSMKGLKGYWFLDQRIFIDHQAYCT